LLRVIEAGGDPGKCTFAGVGKTREEIEFALRESIYCFNAESEEEVAYINQVAGEMGVMAPVAFRVNPNVDAKAHKYTSTGKPENKFGVDYELIEGAYALLFMTETQLVAAQDPRAFHPLALGKLDEGWVVASETCALDVCGAEFVREIEPGEMLVIDTEGLHSQTFMQPSSRSICSFEYIYFARPDSEIDGISVHNVRKEMGRQICREVPTEADVVIGVPDSGLAAAIGFAEESGLPYEMGMMKNRYVGRTFIQPNQELRRKGVRMKLSVVRKAVEGKRVILVDDSIVRGTTSGRIVELLKAAGATEVHMRVTSPPITHPCLYGIDTARRMELISATQTPEEICQKIGADSLHFISVEGIISATGRNHSTRDRGHCLACFNGNYPTPTC